MKNIPLFFIFTLLLCSCKQKSKEEISSKDSLVVSSESVSTDAARATVVQEQSLDEGEEEGEVTWEQLNYVVVVAEGYHYDSLKTIAIRSAKYLDLKFDTLGMTYDRAQKKIILPRTDQDEVGEGEYIFRRDNDDLVSIEMMYAYPDTLTARNETLRQEFVKDKTKLFVFAALYPEKERADSLVKILRPKFPKTRIIPSYIYMGCMH